ncbi:hypothetical protein [Paracoccus fontiphilus]|uniref:Uncharacterized protein n=1 Tax=Paracoccus fontiphilus TaxID=1815556 RepID=A0ABV7IEV5_9RHOB|nr:hypothetical protein [Paracoccus fontiphilus]
MTEGRTFTVATDAEIVNLIEAAQRRLVVIAPALSLLVAKALARRFNDLDHLDVRVIVDADPEVYRLGFGEQEALEEIRQAATRNLLDLREQTGVRIGVVISDDTTMIFAPVSKNIEAGSETAEKPNAIMLRGSSSDSLISAAGADPLSAASKGEIGNSALDPAKVEAMQADLARNPPAKFDIARRMQVFTSRVVYVEFEIKNFTLSRKQVPLPRDFQTVVNAQLRDQITSRLTAPIAQLGAVKVSVGTGDSAQEELIDDTWLRKARKQIEDLYTFQIDNFGRVILREDREKFDAAIQEFTTVVESYHAAVRKALDEHRKTFRDNFVAEFLPRWKTSPPTYMSQWGRTPDETSLSKELENRANEVFDEMMNFAPPTVRLVEKNVSPKNVEDPRFLDPLRRIMEKRRVPRQIIESLFASGDAAPQQPDFLDLS